MGALLHWLLRSRTVAHPRTRTTPYGGHLGRGVGVCVVPPKALRTARRGASIAAAAAPHLPYLAVALPAPTSTAAALSRAVFEPTKARGLTVVACGATHQPTLPCPALFFGKSTGRRPPPPQK